MVSGPAIHPVCARIPKGAGRRFGREVADGCRINACASVAMVPIKTYVSNMLKGMGADRGHDNPNSQITRLAPAVLPELLRADGGDYR